VPAAPQPPSDADAAKNAAASGKWDVALASARLAVWKQPDNKEMADLASEAAYQQAVRLGQAALTAGDLDAALDNADVAITHKPDSAEAAGLLRKARQAIGDAHPYIGKRLTSHSFNLRLSMIAHIYPYSDGKSLVLINGLNSALFDPVAKSLKTFPFPGFYFPATGAFVLPIGSVMGERLARIDAAAKTVWEAPGLYPLGFSPDGKRFAAYDANGITVLNSETGQPISKTPSPLQVVGVAWAGFSSDGKLGAFADGGMGPAATWNVFDADKGGIVHTCEGHRGYDAAFGGTNRFASSTDIEIAVLDTATWKSVAAIETAGSCDFSQDGKRVIVSTDREIGIYDAASGDKVAGPIARVGGVGHGYSLSDDRSLLFAFSPPEIARSRIEAYNVSDGKPIGKFTVPGARGTITTCDPLPDGRIAVGDFTGFLTFLTPPKIPEGAGNSPPPAHVVEGAGIVMSPEDAAKADEAIASLKQTYGIDVVFKVFAQLPVPKDLPAAQTAPPAPDAHAALLRYLRDSELTSGTPGFYIAYLHGGAVAWDWYPGSAASALSADDAQKVGAMLDTLPTQQPGQRLRQFLGALGRKLQQAHP